MLPREVTLEIVRGVWLALGLLWVAAHFSAKPTAVRQPRRSLVAYALLLLVSFVLLSGELPSGRRADAAAAAGIGRAGDGGGRSGAGGLVAAGAGAELERRDRTESGSRTRGTWALMRFVRHPIYTGLLVMFLGTALVRGTAQAFGAFTLFFVVHLWKLRAEEALLAQRFPGAFAAYRARTKALVPFVF